MIETNLRYVLYFVAWALAQILLFNQINLFGFINPYPYMLFILVLPISMSRGIFLLVAFLLGWTIDIFSLSGGVHAASTLTLAFFRPLLLPNAVKGTADEQKDFRLRQISVWDLIPYLTSSILLHHLILFSLEAFSTHLIWDILKKTLFSTIFTLLMGTYILSLFRKKR